MQPVLHLVISVSIVGTLTMRTLYNPKLFPPIEQIDSSQQAMRHAQVLVYAYLSGKDSIL